jgi:hypothetical protein
LGVRVSSRAAERIVAVKTRYLAPMSTKLLPVWSLLLLAGCAPSALAPLLVDGQELHASLATRKLNDVSRLHVPRAVIRDNPYLSTDVEFVDAIAHSASQGRLGGDGVRAALYALYLGESELGLYGLEGASIADTDRLEGALRRIWAHNERLGRARVHREGLILVVVWNDGMSPSSWDAVNGRVVKLLTAPGADAPVRH